MVIMRPSLCSDHIRLFFLHGAPVSPRRDFQEADLRYAQSTSSHVPQKGIQQRISRSLACVDLIGVAFI